jgi:hypothetical protein
MTAIASRLRAQTFVLVAMLAVTPAALGATATDVLAASKRHSTHHRSSPHRAHHKSSGCHIPQNGGGDNDVDNHGGPSDGDGCV